MALRWWPTLPKDASANGLGQLEKLLMQDPDGEQVVLCRVKRRRATIDDITHDTVPQAMIMHAELVPAGQRADQVRSMMLDLLQERDAGTTLPFPKMTDPEPEPGGDG